MITKIQDPSLLDYSPRVQNYCLLPYPHNPEGCPNRGKSRPLRGFPDEYKPRIIRECPPTIEQIIEGSREKLLLIDRILDFSQPLYAIWTEFELGKDAEERFQRTRAEHPDRTPEHCYNKRWWQDRARGQLYGEAMRFLDEFPGAIVDLCPEAHGVDLSTSMPRMGIEFTWYETWPPEHSLDHVVRYVALGGTPLDEALLVEKGMLGKKR